MVAYLSLDLDHITIDAALAKRLPPGLASYYLAVPLGDEDGAISVAMAHPENRTALAVLRALLGAPIVSVRAPASLIRRALAQSSAQPLVPEMRVLVWSAGPGALAETRATGELFARCPGATVTTLAGPEIDLEAVATIARAGAYDLTVVDAPEATMPALLCSQVETPVLLLRKPAREWRRILVVLRGFTADGYALDWLTPLLQQQEATITLLPLANETSGLPGLALNGPTKSHLQDCLRHPALQDRPVFVRYRQGRPGDQIVAEAQHGSHDLVVIAAEGYGAFINHILTALEREGDNRQQSFFILKPPTPVRADHPAILERNLP
jgi:hypothetical protein